ncbi:SIR2 family protein [Qipengyuania profunda]|uniref:SIR2 family NAD-dependent protein deacylase n=1 Tax=Qipengyuania profunda TaxID=3113984 RepID=UPI002A18DBEC|nr:SIR2 family protein [Qipengyuania sp. HL-TH1]WPL58125.1 SIR2 family protein [Qipengyuania sp. HL-TH5]
MSVSFHNPDQYMASLRTIIAQGRKRVGLLVGAGAPAGMARADGSRPLIPAVAGLTELVLKAIEPAYGTQIKGLQGDLAKHDIETLLSRIRSLGSVIGTTKVHELDADGYRAMANAICVEIGKIVQARLPAGSTAYGELVSWITGAPRAHAVEIFTTNYDLLFEEAFERVRAPYFDGFAGAREAFFDPASVSGDQLSSRWTRLWKIHGSLGWKANAEGEVVRTGQTDSTHLIFPEHMKYDQTQKAPYAALLDRLRSFLATEDTLLISIGFSYADAHITARIDEALAANPAASVFAFQFQKLEQEPCAVALASRRPNVSVYARDKAVINGVAAPWQTPGELPTKDWGPIRNSYWAAPAKGGEPEFKLGAIEDFARFFANSQTPQAFEAAPAPAVPPAPAATE